MDLAIGFLRSELSVGSGTGVFLLVLALMLSVASINGKRKKNSRLPPGPYGLPFVGYAPFMTLNPAKHFFQKRKKYGDVISVNVGSIPVVVLNGAKSIKEALNKPEFLGRAGHLFDALIPGSDTPFAWNGNKWKEQRIFTNQVFKELGIGRSRHHQELEEEACNFTKQLENYNGKPLDINEPLKFYMTNNLHVLLFGKRFEINDAKAQEFNTIIDDLFDNANLIFTVIFFPWLNKAPYFRSLKKPEKIRILDEFVRKQIDEHKSILDPQNPKDYTDRHLLEAEKKRKKDPKTFITEQSLYDVLVTFYIAGTESVRLTLGWCLYAMAAFPEVQAKVHKQIDEVVGTARAPSFEDQKNLPYIQAVIMEIQRWKTVPHISVPRMTLEDSSVCGYFIPKGTFIIPNLYAAHHDPDHWPKADEFIPERFMSPDGQTVVKNEYYMPFTFGRRNCVGEAMAVAELFIAFTCILHKFTVRLPEGTKPNFEGKGAIMYRVKKNIIRFIPRIKDEE